MKICTGAHTSQQDRLAAKEVFNVALDAIERLGFSISDDLSANADFLAAVARFMVTDRPGP